MRDEPASSQSPRRPDPEDGYRLWLRYDPIADPLVLANYRSLLAGFCVTGESSVAASLREELRMGLSALLGTPVRESVRPGSGVVTAATPASAPELAELGLEARLSGLGPEGFLLLGPERTGGRGTIIAANDDRGLLYGGFHWLRLLQTHQDVASLELLSKPRLTHRMLDHWDNLSGTVERGYAGFSLWDWHKLPAYLAPRYRDYARANASIGINGVALTNVNANSRVLRPEYLVKVQALADAFRAYGIRVYLTARFSAPVELGGLPSADPSKPDVRTFWKNKAAEIYRLIPDFGGFLIKADSEGQPGPHNYERTHAEGANVLAEALAPFGGVVLWRAFVYDPDVPDDRAKQAFNEFVPLDGAFLENVFLQVKNGPIDFQPREPFHPLFGGMRKTPVMLEFQITQEYLGCATHLVYLAPLFKECLDSDTHCLGSGSTVAKVIDGSLDHRPLGGMAGVSNIGSDRNWCGHPFAQANWYAFGRLCWDHELTSESIAREWVGMTFGNDPGFVESLTDLMIESREAVVNYMTPLGLHHIMARDHHYGPGPWVEGGRADWTSVYYHRANESGVGFDRTHQGSAATLQYALPLRAIFDDPERCPEALLLWFHHVPWSKLLKSGRTLWDELCLRYQAGVAAVRGMQRTWASVESHVDPARFEHVSALLRIQEQEARWWRDACTQYFQTFSKLPLPEGVEPPERSLEHYRSVQHHFVPGTPTRF